MVFKTNCDISHKVEKLPACFLSELGTYWNASVEHSRLRCEPSNWENVRKLEAGLFLKNAALRHLVQTKKTLPGTLYNFSHFILTSIIIKLTINSIHVLNHAHAQIHERFLWSQSRVLNLFEFPSCATYVIYYRFLIFICKVYFNEIIFFLNNI